MYIIVYYWSCFPNYNIFYASYMFLSNVPLVVKSYAMVTNKTDAVRFQ